ncbi:hypothetical protein GCM10012279_12860 [Micromonospora yangpuensis]|nr:hypothetical protein GCM10012279_12860 [Micromonospora yangpuensis]
MQAQQAHLAEQAARIRQDRDGRAGIVAGGQPGKYLSQMRDSGEIDCPRIFQHGGQSTATWCLRSANVSEKATKFVRRHAQRIGEPWPDPWLGLRLGSFPPNNSGAVDAELFREAFLRVADRLPSLGQAVSPQGHCGTFHSGM